MADRFYVSSRVGGSPIITSNDLLNRRQAFRQFRPAAPCAPDLRWRSDWPEHQIVFQQRGGKSCRMQKLLPPILRPSAFRDFYAFEQHVKAARSRRGLDMIGAWYELPVFYFSNPSSLVADNGVVTAPAGSQELDYELELGAVIGKHGCDIPIARAWEHVAGFVILNDFSARDLQRAEMEVGLGPAKGKDFATAVGPMLVTRDEVSDRISGEKISLEMRAR